MLIGDWCDGVATNAELQSTIPAGKFALAKIEAGTQDDSVPEKLE
jgi:hypothetical protein